MEGLAKSLRIYKERKVPLKSMIRLDVCFVNLHICIYKLLGKPLRLKD
jgi:hypothetical protein